MPLPNTTPMRWTPRGTSDTLDGTNSPSGAMGALTNLIPDPSTPFCFQCRPAVAQLTAFTGFSSPGVVAVAYQLGTRVYGLVATARNSGHDEPFVYDVPSNTFITLTGVTLANTPATQAATGAWTPPTMSLVGVKLVVTHPGFSAGSNYFGWFDLTTPSAPTWNAGNTSTNALPSIPVAVQQFNNRAYFGLSTGMVYFSDVLSATTITNASQAVQVGDNTAVTAMAALGLITTSGGIVQGLVVFKATTVWQITGDSALSTLALNNLSPAVGTLATRSVANTPEGVVFMANDGIRMVTLTGSVTDPFDSVRVPFMNTVQPSRVAGAYNAGVYRLCLQRSDLALNPYQDYWFDMTRGTWSGPHTFRYDLALGYLGTFLLANTGYTTPGILWRSDPTQNSASTFIEAGVAMTFIYKTAPIADMGRLTAYAAIESTLNVTFSNSTAQQINVQATDDSGVSLGQAVITNSAISGGGVWGTMSWGTGKWMVSYYGLGLRPYNIPWPNPLVFTKMTLTATGLSSAALKISNFQVLYQPLNYIP